MLDMTLNDAKESYTVLKTRKCDNPHLSRIGLLALDYFFLDYRIRTKTKKGISFYEALHNKEKNEHLLELIKRWKKKTPDEYNTPLKLLRVKYQVFQLYYGTINQFRPTFARWIYCMLKPTVGILDFSAGWGGRCLAAMSLGIPYIGVDANTQLRIPYEKMITTYEPAANVKMLFKPAESVDFSQFKYDLVFTSPPYFTIERYEGMPEYKGDEGFIREFFRPVVSNAWKYLQIGGKMALNMPHDMYMSIRDILPKVSKRISMPIKDRNPARASISKRRPKAHELIYVWIKEK